MRGRDASSNAEMADICLLLEGSYPFVMGGVSAWAHELISEQAPLTFHVLSIVPPGQNPKPVYKLPKNVVGMTTVSLHQFPEAQRRLSPMAKRKFFQKLEVPLLNIQSRPSFEGFKKITDLFEPVRHGLNKKNLMNSQLAWRMLVRMYHASMGQVSFLDYFWSWRVLYGSLFTMLLLDLPPARLYHSLCTGYAGLLAARAKMETGRPCLLTEHGIYTNERRIEISAAAWLQDQKSLNLQMDANFFDRSLQDFWIDSFNGYSRICYEACDQILTLYEGNTVLQKRDGASEDKLSVIPNGIDLKRFGAIKPKPHKRPTVALIGRVVPIKDIKTFIRACHRLRDRVPNLRALIMGPDDEDRIYAEECRRMVANLYLDDVIEFTGRVKIDDYLPQIDVCALTSISEAQPLVLLEVGAAGIPSVSTDVGACQEILYGRSDEDPALGPGGIICGLGDPESVSQAMYSLLTDKAFSDECRRVIKQRVRTYYDKKDQHSAYASVYKELLKNQKQSKKSKQKLWKKPQRKTGT